MKIPKHIAIIPDGNRRWAKSRVMNPWEGHREGVKRFWEIADQAYELGVTHLSIWAGSYDNLHKRSKMEVDFLLRLLREEILNPELTKKFHANKARVEIIGEWRLFVTDKKTIDAIAALEQNTAHYTKNQLTLLFAYDGQREMMEAINILEKKPASETELRNALWTGHLPDVDLVIRTGGEPHWSAGFMMWLTANSQFYFTDMLWPDFKKAQFKKALEDFERRERRLGK